MGAFGAVSRSRTPFAQWQEGRAMIPREETERWQDSEWKRQLGAPARGTPQRLGSYRSGSPFSFYSDAECKQAATPAQFSSKVFNPLATR